MDCLRFNKSYPLEEAADVAPECPSVLSAGVEEVIAARASRPRRSPLGPEGATGSRLTEVDEELS